MLFPECPWYYWVFPRHSSIFELEIEYLLLTNLSYSAVASQRVDQLLFAIEEGREKGLF